MERETTSQCGIAYYSIVEHETLGGVENKTSPTTNKQAHSGTAWTLVLLEKAFLLEARGSVMKLTSKLLWLPSFCAKHVIGCVDVQRILR